MTGQVPFMNSYSPVHSHEIGHLGRFKPLAGTGGIPSYIPIPQFSVSVNKRTVIGMMVFLLGSNEEVAGGRHAGTSSGTDGGIRNAVRPPVDIHHLLFLIHYDQQLSGQRRIIFPLEQVPRNSSRFFKIPRHFFYRNMGRGDRGKLPSRGTAGRKQKRNTQAGNQRMEKG